MKHVATVVTGHSGDPDAAADRAIQAQLDKLNELPIGTKLYAMDQPSTVKMSIYAHSRDCNTVEIYANGKLYDLTVPCRSNGYVPYGLGIGSGDDVELTIDVMTGRIIGWDPQKVLDKIAELDGEGADSD